MSTYEYEFTDLATDFDELRELGSQTAFLRRLSVALGENPVQMAKLAMIKDCYGFVHQDAELGRCNVTFKLVPNSNKITVFQVRRPRRT